MIAGKVIWALFARRHEVEWRSLGGLSGVGVNLLEISNALKIAA